MVMAIAGKSGPAAADLTAAGGLALSDAEQRLLDDLYAIVAEHAAETTIPIDRERVRDAFVFACEHHADQRRLSGEEFIVHPVGVARICASMRLDTDSLCAALLHDIVEDTSTSIEEVRERFGDTIAGIVDGVTKLTGITFTSRDAAQAGNFRKMMVAMATDVRVILIKLADRLHNMRTIAAMPKGKQLEKARETLDIYAPLAHRLGIHAIKWELEDLAFATLHPRKYQEIKALVAQQREERERFVQEAGDYLTSELAAVDVGAQISGRAKHFYSIYSKMTRKDREFNEIYDLTAMRVIVDSVSDCYGAVGVIHSLWKPLPGRFKDFIAMPEVQHVPVAAHDGDRARGKASGDPDPHAADARDGRVRRRGALGVQAAGRRRVVGGRRGREAQVAADDDRLAEGTLGSRRVHAGPSHRPLRGGGLRLHAKGRGSLARRRRDAARLRLRGAHRDRPPLCRRPRQREDRAALLRARERRHRRNPHRQARARPLARLARGRQDDAGAQQDQGLAEGRVAGRHRARGPRAPAGAAAKSRAAGAEDRRFGAARRRDPRSRLPQGRRLLHRPRRRRRSRRSWSSTRSCSA